MRLKEEYRLEMKQHYWWIMQQHHLPKIFRNAQNQALGQVVAQATEMAWPCALFPMFVEPWENFTYFQACISSINDKFCDSTAKRLSSLGRPDLQPPGWEKGSRQNKGSPIRGQIYHRISKHSISRPYFINQHKTHVSDYRLFIVKNVHKHLLKMSPALLRCHVHHWPWSIVALQRRRRATPSPSFESHSFTHRLAQIQPHGIAASEKQNRQ